MFNDRFGLTDAVIAGDKTMTRRIVPEKIVKEANAYVQQIHGSGLDMLDYFLTHSHYKVNEIVAVAQKYKDIMPYLADSFRQPSPDYMMDKPGYNNKMFVCADQMPHQIHITDIKVERLQDISAEDVYKEGFEKVCVNNGWGNAAYHWGTSLIYYDDWGRSCEIRSRYAKEAYEFLFEKICGRKAWEDNPYVYVYSFKRVK